MFKSISILIIVASFTLSCSAVDHGNLASNQKVRESQSSQPIVEPMSNPRFRGLIPDIAITDSRRKLLYESQSTVPDAEYYIYVIAGIGRLNDPGLSALWQSICHETRAFDGLDAPPISQDSQVALFLIPTLRNRKGQPVGFDHIRSAKWLQRLRIAAVDENFSLYSELDPSSALGLLSSSRDLLLEIDDSPLVDSITMLRSAVNDGEVTYIDLARLSTSLIDPMVRALKSGISRGQVGSTRDYRRLIGAISVFTEIGEAVYAVRTLKDVIVPAAQAGTLDATSKVSGTEARVPCS